MRFLPVVLSVLLLTLPAFAMEEGPAPLAIGASVPDFEVKDLDGETFSLAAAREITEEQATAALQRAMERLELDAFDPEKAKALMQEAGRPFGLIVDDETAADVESAEDITAWITDSADMPLVFMCWSPMCPTSRRYETRLQEAVAAAGARFYALASNTNKRERDEDAKGYLAKNQLPYRVLLDRDQKVCDIFGGKVTPHVFVVDGEGRLAYAGAIDSDPRFQTESADERQNWLAAALDALANEAPVDVQRTRAKG